MEHDFQTPSLHFNYNSSLPDELRLWTTGEKERWGPKEIIRLIDFLEMVLEDIQNEGIYCRPI